MRRAVGIAFGLLTHAVFFITVWRLFGFLSDTSAGHPTGSLWRNAFWATLFAVPHSVLLLPAVRKRLESLIPRPFYGCFYSLVTCLALLVLIDQWQSDPTVVWQLEGWSCRLVQLAFLASWPLLMYSLSLTGLGYQTGWTPWWHWFKRQPAPPRKFTPHGLYRWTRHPVYLSFLGLIWFTPTMTLDHAVLTGVWTVYIFIGSYLKDRRLAYYLGDSYRRYQAEVVGYPGMLIGPLARVPLPEA